MGKARCAEAEHKRKHMRSAAEGLQAGWQCTCHHTPYHVVRCTLHPH